MANERPAWHAAAAVLGAIAAMIVAVTGVFVAVNDAVESRRTAATLSTQRSAVPAPDRSPSAPVAKIPAEEVPSAGQVMPAHESARLVDITILHLIPAGTKFFGDPNGWVSYQLDSIEIQRTENYVYPTLIGRGLLISAYDVSLGRHAFRLVTHAAETLDCGSFDVDGQTTAFRLTFDGAPGGPDCSVSP
jgi:hypothetical protein